MCSPDGFLHVEQKKQFYSMLSLDVYSNVEDVKDWMLCHDLTGTDIFWIYAKPFPNVPPATGGRQDV